LSDSPDKIDDSLPGTAPGQRVFKSLSAWLRTSRRTLDLVSPYFVPGDAGVQGLVDLARRGVAVRVITNSLAATDVVAVHAGYARHRRALLAERVHALITVQSHGSRGAARMATVLTDGADEGQLLRLLETPRDLLTISAISKPIEPFKVRP
jgi:phosphatidylserine/phosphatidylglycerophosphate/cardiolipin synthase-like enzyme